MSQPKLFLFDRRTIIRLFLLIGISLMALFILRRISLLNFRLVREAPSLINPWMGCLVLSLLVLPFLGAWRFSHYLRSTGMTVSFTNLLMAGYISQALGQWTSGSMPITELARFGVISALKGKDAEGNPSQAASHLKARIALAIFLDRSNGLGMTFLIGALFGFSLLLQRDMSDVHGPLIIIFSVSSLMIGSLLLSIHRIAYSPFLRRALWGRVRVTSAANGSIDRAKGLSKASSFFGMMRLALRDLGQEHMVLRNYPAVLLLSAGIACLNPLSVYFSARGLDAQIPLPVLFISVPFMVISVMLPLGFAGYGGQQLLIAGVFSLFHIRPDIVVIASLVQNTAALIIYSFIGGFCAWRSLRRLRTGLEPLTSKGDTRRP